MKRQEQQTQELDEKKTERIAALESLSPALAVAAARLETERENDASRNALKQKANATICRPGNGRFDVTF